jgi:hypothetical protein
MAIAARESDTESYGSSGRVTLRPDHVIGISLLLHYLLTGAESISIFLFTDESWPWDVLAQTLAERYLAVLVGVGIIAMRSAPAFVSRFAQFVAVLYGAVVVPVAVVGRVIYSLSLWTFLGCLAWMGAGAAALGAMWLASRQQHGK